MKNKVTTLALAVLTVTLLFTTMANAASYQYTGRDKTVQVEVARDRFNQPIYRLLDLRNGSYYSEDQIKKLGSGLSWHFSGYGTPPRPAPTDFESGRSYMYSGRDKTVEVEVARDRFNQPIYRLLDLRNGSYYSGDQIKKLGSGYRHSFILRAAAPIALVAGGLGLTAESAEASKIHVENDGGAPRPVRLNNSNVGDEINSIEEELSNSSRTPSRTSKGTAR